MENQERQNKKGIRYKNLRLTINQINAFFLKQPLHWYIRLLLLNIGLKNFLFHIIFTFILFVLSVTGMTQPVANFSASSTSGCSPLTNVQFTDLSTGTPTSWLWKKNGVQFSTLQNPTTTFSSAGTYTISLTASNSSGNSTFNKTITVYSNPTSNFAATSSTSGCLPHTVSFQDNSTATNATITNRLWSFGDGGQSSAANPNHTYTLSGNFPVSLKVTDNHGCEDTKQIPNYIQVYPLPNAAFSSSSQRQACAPPISVAFTNNSTGSGTLSYLWKFGDGSTSTSANPSHTYTTMGSFNVKLITTDGNACSDSVSYPSFVQIQSITAGFTSNADSVCFGDSILFNNNSQGANTFQWNFGDNTSGTGYSTAHVYQDSGWFQVRMIASIPAAGCSDTAFRNVYIQRVVADFETSTSYICQLPDTVVYTNNSVNWDFQAWYRDMECPRFLPEYGCGDPSNDDTTIYHMSLINVERIYTDTLVVSSKLGCIDTMIEDTSVIVSLVRGGPILNQAAGCRPYTINFSSLSAPYNSSVMVPNPPVTLTSFEWKIDDTLYSILQNPPSLLLTDTGIWSGTYTVTNSLGCEWVSTFNFRAGDSVNADFYVLKDTICVSEIDSAITLSSDTNFITSYKWFTLPSSGQIQGKTAIFSPKGIGSYAVGHIVEHHGCGDTIVKYNSFYAQGPLVEFYPTLFNCTDSTKISFISNMQQAARWYWDFGDSTLSIDSTSINPIVNYSKKGVYTITLTAYSADSACVHSDAESIIAANIESIISTDTGSKSTNLSDYMNRDTIRGCAPFRVHFTSHNSPSGMVGDWYFDGNLVSGVGRDSIISYNFKTRGYHSVKLIVFDTVANCSDTSEIVVAAYKPIADFNGNPSFGCTPLNVQLVPTVNTLNKIVDYYWSVGTIIDTNTNFTHTFTNATNLNARLLVTDSFGCSDTLVKLNYVRASSFNIDFYATNVRQLCAGDSLLFQQVIPVTNVEYTWIYGNGDSATGKTPYLNFPDSGLFDVKLIAIDTISGCEKVLLKPNYVSVQALPNPDFFGAPSDSTCYPLPVQFYSDSNMPYYNDLNFYWILGDFSAASNYPDPFYNYVRPGSYTVSLIVTTTFGCKDTIIKPNYINIGGSYGEIDFSPDSICRSDSVRFQLLNPINVQNFGFDFGDGNFVLNSSPVWHTYVDSIGQIYPTLFFTDSAGGCAKTFTDTVYIFETQADFSLIDTIGCVPFDPQINNLSTQANSYKWDFGDGSSSKTKNPLKIYNKPGNYRIALQIKGNGCSDSVFQSLDVYPVPIAIAKSDTLICEGDSVQLYSEGGERYTWSPAGELNDYQLQNPIAFPQFTVGYEVLVTDTNGCEDVDSVMITVQNPIRLPFDDLVLIVGDTLTLQKAYGGKGVTYQWIPSTGLSCDTCARPKLTALESGTYTVIIRDTNGCFETASVFDLEVEDKYTLDVPEAFTPNGDGINDIIYVRGWGIKELITFKIFNRWGELIFESQDLSIGWDGTYKGKMQGVETYAYYVEGLTYGNTVLKKKGNINLLK